MAVAGALLILSGAFYTLIGIKTKWLHVSLSTAYLFSLAVTVLIIYVMHPPVSNAIQGAYLVAIVMTGLIFGGIAVVFADVTEGLGCLIGGFTLSMWFLVLKADGLITSTAGRAIFIGCFTAATFGLYISHHTRPYGLIGSTSFAGATAIVLGVDMFSRAGLKEFWVYIWNLNRGLFPFQYDGPYPITRGIRVETACIFILFVLGVMSQMKVWQIVRQRREQRAAEQKRQEQEREKADEDLGRKLEEGNERDRAVWDAAYGDQVKSKESHVDSSVSTETSTRKGSMSIVDVQEVPDEGIELRNMSSSSSQHAREGRILVHVAQDDEAPEPAPSNPVAKSIRSMKSNLSIKSTKSKARTSMDVHEHGTQPDVGNSDIADASPVKATKTKKTPLADLDVNAPRQPKVPPLPFKVPYTATTDEDDKSSVATFAASDRYPSNAADRLSGSSIVRRFSLKTKRRSQAPSESAEALVNSQIDSDTASSLDATVDGMSVEEVSPKQSPVSDTFQQHPEPLPTETLDESPPEVKDPPNEKAAIETTGDQQKPTPAEGKSENSLATPSEYDTANVEITDAESGITTPKLTRSVKTAATSETDGTSHGSEQQPNPRTTLAPNLPEAASKVVMAYRTNEWAKHLSNADIPEVDDLKSSPQQPSAVKKAERVAPVDVQALGQTSLTAEPEPLPSTPKPLANKVSVSTLFDSTVSDKTSNEPAAQLPQHPRHTVSNPILRSQSTSSPISAPSRTSLISNPEASRRPSLKARLSQSALPSHRGLRSSSTPLISSPLAETPIEEGVEASFKPRFAPMPDHLMSQRDSRVRARPQSTSLQARTSQPPPLARRSSSSSSLNASLSNIGEDDDIPLSRRKSLLQLQQGVPRQQQPSDPKHQSYFDRLPAPNHHPNLHRPQPATYLEQSNPKLKRPSSTASFQSSDPVRNPSRLSTNHIRGHPLSNARPESPAILAWRASLAGDHAHANLQEDADLEDRRQEMIEDKQRIRSSVQHAAMVDKQRKKMVEREMRRGNLADAHKEAMRKMQGQVNQDLNRASASTEKLFQQH